MTADALPTVQINGVAWAQVVVGNTVYVAGKFTTARPAGAAAGTQETVRNNLLAYDIRTGELITSFAPNLNGQALAVTASPDGSPHLRRRRLHPGQRPDPQPRRRLDTATGAAGRHVPAERQQPGARDRRDRRHRLPRRQHHRRRRGQPHAAWPRSRPPTARCCPWAPVPGVGSTAGNRLPATTREPATSNEVLALVLTGGGAPGRRRRPVRLASTASRPPASARSTRSPARPGPFAVNQLITNQGVNSAVCSLSTDGDDRLRHRLRLLRPGQPRGLVRRDRRRRRACIAVNDCRGDNYSQLPARTARSTSPAHAHECGNIGGFPEQDPRVNKFATALSTRRHRHGQGRRCANSNFVGQPAPSLLNWFPTMTAGTFTGQGQAGWSVTGNEPVRRLRRRVPAGQRRRPAGPGPLRRAGDRARTSRPGRRRRSTPTVVAVGAGSRPRVAGRRPTTRTTRT